MSEFENNLEAMLGAMLEAFNVAVKEEREACAKIADGHKIKISDASASYWNDCGHNEAAVEIADKIRQRGQS